MPRHRGTRTPRGVLPLVSGALTACLLGAAVVAVLLGGVTGEAPAAPVAITQGAPVAAIAGPETTEPAESPADPPSAAIAPAIESDGRLVIPTVLDAELRSMKVKGGVVNPPTSTEAYQGAGPGYGTPGDPESGTVFVALHTSRWDSGEALGDALIDGRDAAVGAGDRIYLDGVTYRVTETFHVDKKELPGQKSLWNGSAGLVLLACQQNYLGSGSTENLVVLADRA